MGDSPDRSWQIFFKVRLNEAWARINIDYVQRRKILKDANDLLVIFRAEADKF